LYPASILLLNFGEIAGAIDRLKLDREVNQHQICFATARSISFCLRGRALRIFYD
jgi:hypothetical protein